MEGRAKLKVGMIACNVHHCCVLYPIKSQNILPLSRRFELTIIAQ